MKICTIVGNRPQFIKLHPVSRQLKNNNISEVLIHTGQHYDQNLSDVFFKDLCLPKPNYHLEIHNRTHGSMTGEILEKIEAILIKETPDLVLVYGDTNSTLAGALAAVKLRIPTAHIEAGVRINDVFSPEEANRVMVSHIAQFHFCCTKHNVRNLKNERITKNVFFTGDVMLDTFREFLPIALDKSIFIKNNNLHQKNFILMTFHRPENVDSEDGCKKILYLIEKASKDAFVVFPIHPRTKAAFIKHGVFEKLNKIKKLILTEPLSYLDTLSLLTQCEFVLTDSGGLQREAFFARKFCYFFFKESCWPEIEEIGWQRLCNLFENAFDFSKNIGREFESNPFGACDAAKNIVDIIKVL